MSGCPFWGIGSIFANPKVKVQFPQLTNGSPTFGCCQNSYATSKVAIILIPSTLGLAKIDPTPQRRQSFTSSHGDFISFAILYIWPYPSKRGITHKLTWWLHFIFGICSGVATCLASPGKWAEIFLMYPFANAEWNKVSSAIRRVLRRPGKSLL
jgi:hypothetical protein